MTKVTIDKAPRATRDTEKRRRPWTPPSRLDAPPAPEGFKHRWIRAELQKALNDLSRTVRIPSHRTATEEYSTKSISTPVGEDENKETYADRYLQADEVRSSRDRADMRFDIDRVKVRARNVNGISGYSSDIGTNIQVHHDIHLQLV